MKNLLFSFAFLSIVLFIGCGGYPDNPEEVTKKYVEAYYAGDIEDAKTYLTGRQLEKVNQMLEGSGEAGFKQWIDANVEKVGGVESIEVIESEINEEENTAEVKVEIKYGGGDSDKQTVYLEMADEKWMIRRM